MLRSIFVIVVIFASGSLNAQIKNIKLDEQSESDFVCEPSIAVNPRNPKNIVAASVLNNIYFTKDGGATWQKRKVESSFGVYGDPALIADGSGTFYFFHLSDPTHGKGGYDSEKLDRMVVQISYDGGDTWSDGEFVGLHHPKDQDKEWPAIDAKGNLVLTWTEFDKYGDTDPGCKSRILMSRSKNGKKWSDPITISQTEGDCLDNDNTVMGAVPAFGPDGKIFVAWSFSNKIYMDRSYDGEMWLSNDLPLADQVHGWDLTIPGHDRCNGLPVIATDRSKSSYKGFLYLIWADQRNGENDTDVWLTRTANFGDNWSTPVKIDNDTSGKHQYLPWLTVDQTTGNVYVLYYDRKAYDDIQTDVWLAWSKDGGASFRNLKISETPFVPDATKFFGDYTNISAAQGIITPVWTRMDKGKTSVWTAVIKQEELDKLK